MLKQRTAEILSVILFLAMLAWGGYVMLNYFGYEIHGEVLLSPEWKATVAEACGSDAPLCRGWYAIGPSIAYAIGRMAPLLWYLLFSAILYGAWVGVQAVLGNESEVRLRLSPWKIAIASVVLLWLLFTALATSKAGDMPVTRLFQPTVEVYPDVGPEALAALQENFTMLQGRGCLTPIGQTDGGTSVYDVKVSCMQGAFFSRVLPQLAFIAFVFVDMLLLGSLLLSFAAFRPRRAFTDLVVSSSLGACALVAILWLLALAGLVTPLVGWLLLLLIPVAAYKETIAWGRRFVETEWEVEGKWYGLTVFLGWLLLSYFLLNFLSVLRPFPIGWDDLGSYLNRPRLMVSYGHFIPTMAPFQWEYITSLGFWLFGYDSVFGATASMMLNWLAGVFAVTAILAFVRTYLGRSGVLAGLLYYSLPLVGHFSFADMKVDNAVFAMGAMSMFCLFLALFPPEESHDDEATTDERSARLWLILAGVFAGFAFAMKATAIMVIMASLAILVGSMTVWWAAIGLFAVAMSVFTAQGAFEASSFFSRFLGDTVTVSKMATAGTFLSIGALTTAAALWLHRARAGLTTQRAGLYVLALAVAIAPWLVHNNILRGNIIPRPELGAPNTITPLLHIGKAPLENPEGRPVLDLPPELEVDQTNAACVGTSKSEELDRYWGFDSGVGHYLTLPWRTVMNADSAGYYVTTGPALLLFPLLLLLPFLWTRRGRWLRWLVGGTAFLVVEWMLLANGVPWYGIGVFLGLCVGLEAFVARAPDAPNRVVAGIFIGLSLLTAFSMRFWQFEQQRNLYEYALGKMTAEGMRERTIPHYDHIRDVVTERREAMPDRPYVYRMGTFIPYFIPLNLEIFPISDNQLDFFQCLYQEGDAALTVRRLKALGFNSMIFDTNTATIERDPNGTLHKKVNNFVRFVSDPAAGLQLTVNDPGAGVAYILIP